MRTSRKMRVESLERREVFASMTGVDGFSFPVEREREWGFADSGESTGGLGELFGPAVAGDAVAGDQSFRWELTRAQSPDASTAGHGEIADEYLGVVRWNSVHEYYAAMDKLAELAERMDLDLT